MMGRVYTNTPHYGVSIQPQQFPDVALLDIICSGNSDVGAAILPISLEGAGTLGKAIIMAHWVDASNFCLALPTLSSLPLGAEFEIYTDAPMGDSVTVFLRGGDQFTDGTTSLTVDRTKGVFLRAAGYNAGVNDLVWGKR